MAVLGQGWLEVCMSTWEHGPYAITAGHSYPECVLGVGHLYKGDTYGGLLLLWYNGHLVWLWWTGSTWESV